jgi:hypothetical protein
MQSLLVIGLDGSVIWPGEFSKPQKAITTIEKLSQE